MKKVVFNTRYGGFGLSLEAVYALHMLGFPLRTFPLEGSGYSVHDFPHHAPNGIRGNSDHRILLKDGVVYQAKLSGYDLEEVALRSHPILVTVVEKLGKRANARSAHLAIEEIKDSDLYTIEEYDGAETVRIYSPDNYTAGYLMNALEVPDITFAPLLPSNNT